MKSVDIWEAKKMCKDTFEECFSQEPYEIHITAILAIDRKMNTCSILSGVLLFFI